MIPKSAFFEFFPGPTLNLPDYKENPKLQQSQPITTEYGELHFLLNNWAECLWVIPCQINKEFRVTSRILTKFVVFVVPVVLITHANF